MLESPIIESVVTPSELQCEISAAGLIPLTSLELAVCILMRQAGWNREAQPRPYVGLRLFYF